VVTASSDILGGARRVLIYGVTGSGKSTLAARLSTITNIPWHSVDDLTWEPGWMQVPVEEQRRRISAICAQPAWILDTAYSAWMDEPLDRAELIIALDYPRWFSLQRLVRRTIANLVRRRSVCNGNYETLPGLVSSDSIVRWHFTTFRHKRERIRRWMSDSSAPPVKQFTSARETAAWLAGATKASGCQR
jgi:adenylate kinase family enzyme